MDREELQRAQDLLRQIKQGPRSLDQIPNVKPEFDKAKAAKEPLEPTLSAMELREVNRQINWVKPERYNDPEYFKGPDVYNDFNQAAEGVNRSEASDKRISEMVEKETNSQKLTPPPAIRRPVEQQQFDQDWINEAANAEKATNSDLCKDEEKAQEVAKRAAELEARKRQGPSPGRSM